MESNQPIQILDFKYEYSEGGSFPIDIHYFI